MLEKELRIKLKQIFPNDNQKIDEYVIFQILIKRFGEKFIKTIYPESDFNSKMELLKSLKVFDDFENNDFSDENNLLNMDSISLEWIRYFVILNETGNFDIASHKLNISTRALQKVVSKIEHIFKLDLIIGKTNFKGLTYAGNVFFTKGRNIIQQINDIYENVDNLKRELKTTKIGIALDFYWLNTLSDSISKLKNDFPDTYFKIYFMENNNIEKWVNKWIENSVIDLALVFNKPSSKSIGFIEGKKTPYVIVGKPQEKRNWKDLNYIFPSNYFPPDNKLFNDIYDKRISIDLDWSFVLEFCEDGLGVTFLPLIMVKEKIDRGTLAIIADPPSEFYETPYIVYNRNILLNDAIIEFIRIIKKKIT